MSRTLRTLVLLSLASMAAVSCAGLPQSASAIEPSPAAEIRRGIDEIDSLREAQDLRVALHRLNALVGSAAYIALLAEADEVVLPMLDELDALAVSLGSVRTMLVVREERVRMLEQARPADDLDLIGARKRLALTLSYLGDDAGALELFESVRASRERILPADHPDLLAATQSVAVTRHALGDLAGALELLEPVTAKWERLLPADDPELLECKRALALVRRDMGDLSGALELLEQVHAAWALVLPPDHPDLLRARQDLAETRAALDDLQGANELEESG